MPRLENWSVQMNGDAYKAPEQLKPILVGEVYGDVGRPDGVVINTSPIQSAEGRFVTTKSGSIYELGDIDQEYYAFLDGIGHKIDPHNPVKITTA